MRSGEFDPSSYQEYLDAGYDPYHAFINMVPGMIDMARFAAHHEAMSYRKFHVGAALFAVEFDGHQTATLSGGNIKLHQTAPKYCAEMNVIDQAEAQGLHHAIGIVIAATNDPRLIEDVTGKVTPTLHPCDACLAKMQTSSVIDPETLIITVALDEDRAQVHTYAEMSAIYQIEGDPALEAMGPLHDLDLDRWERRQFIYDRFASASDNLMAPPDLARLALTSTISVDD